MPTETAKYIGSGAGDLIQDFSIKTRGKLRAYYPDKNAEEDPDFGHPADDFVNSIIGIAWSAKSAMHWIRYDSSKGEIRAEQKHFLKLLKSTSDRARKLSPDFNRLLGIDAAPLGCADNIDELIRYVEATEAHIERLPDKISATKPQQKERRIAVLLSKEIIRYIKTYGLSIGATADDYGAISDAISILKILGEDIGLERSVDTWKSIVAEANDLIRHDTERWNSHK